jgi:membrane-associated phospholipid phosphatase
MAKQSRRSAAGNVARQTALHFRAGWLELPSAARRRWMRRTAVSAIALCALLVLLLQWTRLLLVRGQLDWERPVLQWIALHAPFSFSTGVWLQTFGSDITLWFVVPLSAGVAAWMHRPITALSIALAYAVVDPVVRLGWLLWDRVRPHIIHDGFAAPPFHAFPSGHTAKTVAVYGVLAYLWVRAAPGWIERLIALALFFGISIVVPLGRLTMGVHWPTDVIAGFALGAIWAICLISGLRLERFNPPDLQWARQRAPQPPPPPFQPRPVRTAWRGSLPRGNTRCA